MAALVKTPVGFPTTIPVHHPGGSRAFGAFAGVWEDYPTRDGSGERDYIHVMDLAEAHVATLDHLMQQQGPIQITLNLGTGEARSVLEVVHAFEQATGRYPLRGAASSGW